MWSAPNSKDSRRRGAGARVGRTTRGGGAGSGRPWSSGHAASVRRKSEASALGSGSVAARRTRVGADRRVGPGWPELVFALPDEDAEAAVERSSRLQSARDEQNRFDAEAAELDAEDWNCGADRSPATSPTAQPNSTLSAPDHRTEHKLEMYRGESRLDEFDEAQAEWEDACAGLRNGSRGAPRAARLLHETLTRATRLESRARITPTRSPAASTNSAPSSSGTRCASDVDDDLNVVSCTVDSVTVPATPFPAAPRQLGLLSRLACATLVDQADGVPVIIDDAPRLQRPRPHRRHGLGPHRSRPRRPGHRPHV